jgi:hypothetical protein
MDNHTLKGDKEAIERSETAAKVQLQQEVLELFATLKSAWGHIIEVHIDEEEPEPEDADVNIDDLFNGDEDFDADYLFEEDSDSEEL